MATAGTGTLDTASLQALLGPQLTAEQAALIFQQGQEAVVFALLTLAKQLAEEQPVASTTPDPSAPSGQTPPYQKPTAKGRAKPKGARPGHPGHRRPAPPRIDRHEEHTLSTCPRCHAPVRPCDSSRTRVVEDIPADITPVVTEHTIRRYWCPGCRATVEPVVTDALPGSAIGLRVVVLSAWLHYLLGTTLAQIVDVFNFHLHFELSAGGLVQMWHRLREVLLAWYLEIQAEALGSAVLHADETGWRVNGKTHWLWCFTTTDVTYYMIDRSRGSPALKRFFKEEFAGVLVTDFWAAYNAVVSARKQKCLPHLLRDLKRTQHYHNPGGDWPAFCKLLRRLIRDALRLSKRREELSPEGFAARRRRLQGRLHELLGQPWEQRHARRLVKRLRRHESELFTFLDRAEVPPDNNHAERQIRPAVMVRKNSYANGSDEGAETQSVLMSVFRTLKQRGHNPVSAVLDGVRDSLRTGQLPPLPARVAADG
ncbi:Transposase IS66 family protein [Aquisphaera giovannonii]|uniref:Transposase IS66 family protein n=1 Tax=Aquisphaera giovannonii TaxID=406548 RepID=A0A5B9W7Q4_9BACT|nr:IS66 family transposase [Aquisphaera giovannonii]QEH36377.1 Transposase IS66 family protein [Aquisphaera giovannonii]